MFNKFFQMMSVYTFASAFILTLGAAGKANAVNWWQTTSGSCGYNCTYTIDENRNLTVTGTGPNASINKEFFRGVSPNENSFLTNILEPGRTDRLATTVNDITISGIKSFGDSSFQFLHVTGNISVSDTDRLQGRIMSHAIVDGDILLSDEIQSMAASSFWSVRFDGNLVLPENATVGSTLFRNGYVNGNLVITEAQCNTSLFEYWSKAGSNAKIYCQGNCNLQACKNRIRQNAQFPDQFLSKIFACAGGDCSSQVCGDGYSLDSNGRCLSSCPSNCSTCTSSTSCSVCNNGYYALNGSCESCSSFGAASCHMDGEELVIDNCSSGYKLFGNDCYGNCEQDGDLTYCQDSNGCDQIAFDGDDDKVVRLSYSGCQSGGNNTGCGDGGAAAYDYLDDGSTLVYDDQCRVKEILDQNGDSTYDMGDTLLSGNRRTSYTPAEAVAIVGDSEDNIIVMYFK